jgi:predicted enzyme related to lactoylglutathione lyase
MFNGESKIAAMWLYSRNPEKAGEFYRTALQMKQIEHGDTFSFDGGGVRLSIHPLPKGAKETPGSECFIVFFVAEGIEERVMDLNSRGVKVGEIEKFTYGKIAEFKDPDGHYLYLWQPPPKDSSYYADVSQIVEHYETISSKLGSKK